MINTAGVYIYEHGKIIEYKSEHRVSTGTLHEYLARAIQRREQLDETIENMRKLLLDHYDNTKE